MKEIDAAIEALEAALSDDQPYIDRCNAALADAQKDAMRYRWLRDKATVRQWSYLVQSDLKPEVDAAIDAAMQAGGKT